MAIDIDDAVRENFMNWFMESINAFAIKFFLTHTLRGVVKSICTKIEKLLTSFKVISMAHILLWVTMSLKET